MLQNECHILYIEMQFDKIIDFVSSILYMGFICVKELIPLWGCQTFLFSENDTQ
jgi:hypothetical protein